MQQLLEIKSIPISFEFKVNPARYEMKCQRPALNLQRDRGGLTINTQPAKLKVDTYEARASLGLKSVGRAVSDIAHESKIIVEEAIGNIVSEGNQMADIHIQSNVFGDIAFQRSQTTIDTMLGFLPSVKADIDFDPGKLSMRYEMDKLTFDWRINNKPDLQFIPGSVEYIVKQYPRLEIEYKGKPVYVPPSADPESTPPELDITA